MIQQKIVWNEASRAAYVLGGISVAYMAVNMLLPLLKGGAAVSVLVSVGSLLLWLFKFVLCIRLFKFFMQRFAMRNPECTNADTFRFGVIAALLSAIIYSAFYLAWVTLIQPDALSASIETAKEAYANIMTAEQLDSFDELVPKLPGMTFFVNLIYCFLFGLVLSAIFSRNIPSRNPFAPEYQQHVEEDTDDQDI